MSPALGTTVARSCQVDVESCRYTLPTHAGPLVICHERSTELGCTCSESSIARVATKPWSKGISVERSSNVNVVPQAWTASRYCSRRPSNAGVRSMKLTWPESSEVVAPSSDQVEHESRRDTVA